MIHLPLLRKGEPYVSLDTAKVPHYRTGDPVAELSLANPARMRIKSLTACPSVAINGSLAICAWTSSFWLSR